MLVFATDFFINPNILLVVGENYTWHFSLLLSWFCLDFFFFIQGDEYLPRTYQSKYFLYIV